MVYNININKTDTYNMSHCNFDNLPIKIITGNSVYNIDKVTNTATKYELGAQAALWPHSGVWLVTNRRDR